MFNELAEGTAFPRQGRTVVIQVMGAYSTSVNGLAVAWLGLPGHPSGARSTVTPWMTRSGRGGVFILQLSQPGKKGGR